MTTSSEAERGFYNRQYAQYLALPDHALRIDRGVLEGNCDNPAHPFYERRRLYRATIAELESEQLRGLRVLDYGCGVADFGLWMATAGAEVTLLDLSPRAIELGLKRAAASGVTVRGVTADASHLPMFQDAEFDLVFACAALHHTMKYSGALEELARVLRPAGRLILCETWGGNPVLNMARRLRAVLAGEREEQGEEIILGRRELCRLDPWFDSIGVQHLNLLAMAKRLLRGRFEKRWARWTVSTLETLDRALVPLMRNWCGEAVIAASRRTSGRG